MTIKAIVFDMDDTLYAEKDYVRSGFRSVDRWSRDELGITGFYETAWGLFESGQKQLLFNKALEALEVDYDEALIGRMVEAYRSHEPDIQLLDDARWILDQVKPEVKIGLISDGYLTAQQKKVKALKLHDKCHSLILTDQWGKEHWKPSRVPYETVSRELEVSHQQCVYIGDNATKDFVTANRLGWTTIHITRHSGIYIGAVVEEPYKAHYTIDDLRKLAELPVLRHLFA